MKDSLELAIFTALLLQLKGYKVVAITREYNTEWRVRGDKDGFLSLTVVPCGFPSTEALLASVERSEYDARAAYAKSRREQDSSSLPEKGEGPKAITENSDNCYGKNQKET